MAASREDKEDVKAEDKEDSAACAYQKEADETTAEDQAAAEVDDDDDPVIRNLNLMSRRNLMTPEWIENRKKMHYQDIAFYNRVYDALHNGEIETDSDDDDDGTAAAQRSKRLWAGVDLTGLNIVGGESRGMDAVAVYPPNSPQEEGHHAAAAESSS